MNVAFIEMGVTNATPLSSLYKRCSSFFLHNYNTTLSTWCYCIELLLLQHSLSLFSRHFPSFIILTRGFLCFPLINHCLHCWTILVYALGVSISYGNIVSHLTYLDCFSFLAQHYHFLHGIRAWLSNPCFKFCVEGCHSLEHTLFGDVIERRSLCCGFSSF